MFTKNSRRCLNAGNPVIICSFSLDLANLHPVMILVQVQCDFGDAACRVKAEVLGNDLDLFISADGGGLFRKGQVAALSQPSLPLSEPM